MERDPFLEDMDDQRERRVHEEARRDRLAEYAPAAQSPATEPSREAIEAAELAVRRSALAQSVLAEAYPIIRRDVAREIAERVGSVKWLHSTPSEIALFIEREFGSVDA